MWLKNVILWQWEIIPSILFISGKLGRQDFSPMGFEKISYQESPVWIWITCYFWTMEILAYFMMPEALSFKKHFKGMWLGLLQQGREGQSRPVRKSCKHTRGPSTSQWGVTAQNMQDKEDSFFFPFIFISWRLITLKYCSGFCHTLTWIGQGFTCVPHPDPLSHLPPPSYPSGSSQCTSPEHLSHASNLGWWSVSPLIVYLFQCCSLWTPHPHLLPQSLGQGSF